MSRRCVASAVIVLVGVLPAVRADETSDKLIGTWVWRTPPDGNDQYWSVSRDGDKWTVKGWYKNAEGVETGSFVGVDPVYSDGALRYTHRFVKKHFNYKDNTPALIKVDGDQVKYYWNPSLPKKSECILQRVEGPKPAAKEPMPAKPQERFVGVWKGRIETHDEIWTIRKNEGTWTINGKLRSGGVETGSFIGTDIREVDGTLSFTRKFVRKPANSNLLDAAVVVKAEGENLSYTWRVGGQQGTRALEKYAGEEKDDKPAEDELGKFRGYWTADVATGFRVVMHITMKKDKIDVSASYYHKNGTPAGSFVGVDPTIKDGQLTFSQKFIQKPVSGWNDGKIHTLEIASENVLKFSWKNGGTEHFARVKK